MATRIPTNRKPKLQAFGVASRICRSQDQPFRPERRAAPGLGRLQGRPNSRRCPVRDLSRSRSCSVQTGPWLFGAAAAVSAGRRFYVDWSFCRARPLRTQPPPRSAARKPSAWDAMHVLRAPSFGAMLELGMLLLVLFGIWIAAADAIYIATFGNAPAASIPDFATRVLTTPEGWSLIIVGCGVWLRCSPSWPHASVLCRFR